MESTNSIMDDIYTTTQSNLTDLSNSNNLSNLTDLNTRLNSLNATNPFNIINRLNQSNAMNRLNQSSAINQYNEINRLNNQNQMVTYNAPITTNKRIIYGNTGLHNTGNTCYMNSAIQALSHLFPLTIYFTKHSDYIIERLKNNAGKIFNNHETFNTKNKNIIPIQLKNKIINSNFSGLSLNEEETTVILNNTMTFQLMKLLEALWKDHSIVQPTSFRRIFSEFRKKFFFGYEQQDAEEAYSCILQQIQEELAENISAPVKFKAMKESVKQYLIYKDLMDNLIQNTTDPIQKKLYSNQFLEKRKEMQSESLICESYHEMSDYFSKCYSRLTEIFTGFLHSRINCPDPLCGYSSNKFDPFLHLSLPLPAQFISQFNTYQKPITIQDCMKEYCKNEILDDDNLWTCDKCKKKVRAIKKIQLWTCPQILTIQLKRFGANRITKDNRLINYPMIDLDISDVVSPIYYDSNICCKYTLQCVINHTGNLNGGHYYTYCKDIETSKWFVYNDSEVSPIQSNLVISNHAYMLFYIRQDVMKKI